MPFTPATRVRFTESFLAALVAQQTDMPQGVAELQTQHERGMIVQRYPSTGRVNVKFLDSHGLMHYRTFAERDLTAA